ncbi:amino acid adenylation domain-containing protein, partial [Anaerosporobacter sp.]
MRKSNVEKCYFNKMLTENIEKLCQETNTTIDMVVLSALMVVNVKHTKQDTVTAKVIENDREFHYVKGCPQENISYEQFLIKLKPEENVVLNDSEKIDFNLYMQSEMLENQLKLGDGISIKMTKANEQWNMEWFYSLEYYQAEEVYYFIKHVLLFLENIFKERTKLLKDVLILSEEEKTLVLHNFNQTYTEYNRDETVIDLFEKQAEKYPNNTALIFKNQTVTYLEMNEKVNGLALYLRKMGVKPNDFVMIRAERSIELILAIYGVLKAGGAYISVTSSFPEERVNYMIQDCKPKCILTYGQETIETTGNSEIPVVDLADPTIYEGGKNNPVRVTKMEDICYVIYTSGTTGKPKGVMIKHQGLRNLAASYYDIFRLTERDVVLQFSSTSFDLSVSDIFSIVTSGAALCILPEEYVRDIEKLEEYMDEKGVTTASLTPMLVKELHSEKLTKLRILDCGGEAGNLEVLTHWAKCRRVLNIYGPTETTVNATAFEVYKDTKKLYIGKPIANTQAYILNGEQLCGIGVLGELCIAGESVGIGYLNSPDLTKEKFVKNPFGEGKLYHTGDLTCWTADGNIDFRGRIDEQVKVRGFRIELEDIATVIRKSDKVTDAAVIIRETKSGDKEICAYIVSEDEIDRKELQEEIAKELPSYMLPAYMMQIDQLPVTQNGKLDKKALPDITGARMENYVAPVTDSEKALCEIYEEILEIDKVGSNDSFFDLGGHSLKATYLKNMIGERLGKTIELKDIFKCPIIRQLAEILDGLDSDEERDIQRIEEQDWYDTSPAQKRMYISQSMDKDAIAYNIPIILEVHGEVEKERLRQAFLCLIRRHETLRTIFFEKDGTIYQKIYRPDEISFILEEIHVNTKEELEKKFVEFVKPFDLTKDIPIRGQLVRMGEKTYLFMDVHHINSDATSSSIIQDELCLFYEGKNLENLEVQYKDYIAWEEKNEGSQKKKDAKAYWLDQFKGELHLESLPTDFKRGKRNDFDGKEYVVCLEGDNLSRLRDICKSQNVTLFSLMMSAYSVLLGRLLNSDDVTVGIPVNNRNHSKLEQMVGMFLNTIALRVEIREEESFAKFMDYVNTQIINGMSYQSFQFEELIDQLKIPRESNRTPLFDTIMNFVSDAVAGTEYREGSIQLVEDDSGLVQAKYDITWYINDFGDKLEVRCNYKTGLFKESTIDYIVGQYISILNQVGSDYNHPVGKIHLFERSQKRQDNPVQIEKPHEPFVYETGISLVSCLEEVAERYKDCKALMLNGEILTYAKMQQKTDFISAQLRRAGIKKGDKVSLLCGHNGNMILAMVGVLKAGGTFVPLQADYPKERLSYIIQDTDSKVLLVDKENHKVARELKNTLTNMQVLEITGESIEESTFLQEELQKTESVHDAKQIAYIMYTSGSTGNPKGVIQSCDSILAFMADYINELKLDSSDRMVLVSACNHATGIIDIFSTLLSGGCLYPYDLKNDTGIKGLLKVINEERITVFHAVPSVYRYLIKEKEVSEKTDLRVIVLGGESLQKSDVENYRMHFNDDCYFINLFGSSEVLIATSYVMDKQTELIKDTVPIGYVVPQVESYIIGEDSRVKGVYGTGEIVYQSDYLARGYYNMEQQTNKVFRINPVTGKGMVYYSGDLGKIMPDGRLVYMGRKDHQIKIRGYRIEMDEIEAVMNQVADISQGVVKVFQRDNGENYLVGYYTGVGETEELEQKVRTALREKLPDYMIPSCFLRLEKMPLTSNSKIDWKALPKVEFMQSNTKTGGLPANETEQIICDLYQQVLEIDAVGTHDNFFDLGGHSLKAMVLKNKLYESFGKTVELRDIFEYPSVAELSKRMEQSKIQEEDEIRQVPEQAYYKTSSAQKRMYAAQSMDIMSVTYNNPVIFEINGKAQADKLEQACQLLLERHETLRTTFVEKDGEVFQIVHKAEDISFALVVKETFDKVTEAQLFEEFVKPFNLTEEIPFRVWLVQNGKKQKLFLDVHHINCDVTSIMLLMKELGMLYNQKTLQPLNIQYKDYAQWEQENRESKRFEKAKNYWLKQFEGYHTTAELPTDYRRMVDVDNAGEELTISFTKELLEKLRARCSEDKVTLFAFMLAAYNVLLSRMTGSKDVIVGVPLNNRERKELETISGMFLNTLAIREQVDYTDQFTTLLFEVNKKISDGMANQSYQFEDLIEALNLVRVKNRTPLFDTVMNFVNDAAMDQDKVENGIYFKEEPTPIVMAKYDITWYVYDFGDKVELTCNYKSSLFKKNTMEYILKEYIQLLEQLANNSHKVINQYSLFEKNEVVSKKNQVIIAKDHISLRRTEGVGLVQALESVVEANREKPALKMEQETLTYEVMNERANAIASVITKNTRVGLLCGHSTSMILAMIGVLKAGGTFVPLDVDYPKERLVYILEDTDVECLIVDQENEALGLQLQEKISNLHVYIVDKEQVATNPKIQVPGECPAYIMYTSGSTGRPKGVIQTYDNILSFMIGYINELKLDNKDKMLLVSACNHATGIIDIFSTLLSGGCLYPYDIKKGSGVKGLLSLVQKEEITVFHAVPSVYRYMLREKSVTDKTTLRVIVLGGESLQKMDVENYRKHFDKECYLVNLFGSSEVLIATSYVMDQDTELAGETVPIGYLVPEVSCHILSEEGEEQGIYGAGEIVYESKYLSKGYFNMPEQTNMVFRQGEDSCLLYYSGDLGMLMPDGRLEYLGRKDHQIKIRGYRIELDEIEAIMNQVVGIGQAVVKAYQLKGGENYLAAYYTKDREESNNVKQDLRQVIKEQLPSYMMPACFIEIERMPLTSNAKVDYQALEEPNIEEILTTEFEKPITPMEEKLCHLYEEVLEVDKVGRSDSFFDLGGHSLRAMTLKNRIAEEMKKEVTLKEIFSQPTVAELAVLLEEKEAKHSIITKVEKKERYEVSRAQLRTYAAHSMHKNDVAYNIPVILELSTIVDRRRLEEAINKLIKRHETLRTVFVEEEGKVYQVVKDASEVPFVLDEITVDNEEERNHTFKEFVRPFDLAHEICLRAVLVNYKNSQELFLDLHHINGDASSIVILQQDLISLYEGKELEPLTIQYKDYAVWENNYKTEAAYKDAEKYWCSKFEGELQVHELPLDHQRSNVEDMEGGEYIVTIEGDLLERLRITCKSNKVTMFAVVLTAYDMLLSKLMNSSDVIVGIPVNNREQPALEQMIGQFLNTIAIRTMVTGKEPFENLLQKVNEAIIDGMNYQYYSFEDLLEILHIDRESGRTPLFDTVMNFVSQTKKQDIGEFSMELMKPEEASAKYDMTWYVYDFGDQLEITCNYKLNLFKESTISYITGQFIDLLEQIGQNDKLMVNQYMMFEVPDKVGTNPVVIQKEHKPFTSNGLGLIRCLEQRVDEFKNLPALKMNSEIITYEEMNERANAIANKIEKGQRVSILCGHNSNMIIAMLGVLKASATFVPLDVMYPVDRLSYILSDTQSRYLLVEPDCMNHSLIEEINEKIEVIEIGVDKNKENPAEEADQDQAAYIMYTSGSTGKPKGVIQTYENILAFMTGYINELKLDEKDRMLLVSACNHATGIIDIFSTLLSGGCIYPYDIKKGTGVKGIVPVLREEKITIFHAVPSVYRYMIREKEEQEKTDLRVIVLGGESLQKSDVINYHKHFRPDCYFVNLLGSSEVLIATSYVMDQQTRLDGETVPVGYPVPNVTCFIAGEDKERKGIYGIGEILYESRYLAKGYWNNEVQTKTAFGVNPATGDERVYYSGDLGMLKPDGSLEYLGRKDNQIKIRGYRIELDEIEAVMNQVEGIGQGVIKAYKKENKEPYLAAYYTKENDNIVNLKEQIQKAIKEKLPSYMMPACFIELDVMPLSSNAKVDKRALQEPDLSTFIDEDKVEAQTKDQLLLCKMFEEVLSVTNIGIKDSFFDLGGHSLKAMELKNKISEQLNKNVELKEIFDNPTVEKLANLLDQKEIEETEAIIAVDKQEYYEVSSSQKRMYLAQIVEEDSTAYNNPKIYEIKGDVNKDDITQIYLKLLKRHEALRTGFEIREEQIKQKVYNVEDIDFHVEEYD